MDRRALHLLFGWLFLYLTIFWNLAAATTAWVTDSPGLPSTPAFLSYGKSMIGDGMGEVPSYQTIGLYADREVGDVRSFMDLRGHQLQQRQWAASAGLGIRYIPSGTAIGIGVNAFYDYLQPDWGRFHQLGIGIEATYSRYSLLGNLYCPLGRRTRLGPSEMTIYPGDFVAIRRSVQRVLRGGDFELGMHWTKSICCCPMNLRLGIGGYYYRNPCRCFFGERFRATLTCWDCLTLGAVQTCDEEYKGTFQAFIAISFPFDLRGHRRTCAGLLDRPVIRQEIMVRDRPSCKWATNY